MLQSIVLRTVILSLRSLAFSCLLLSSAFAVEPVTADPVKFKIEPQPLGSALNEFARQSDRELLFATEVVENKEAQLVVGVYEPEEALELLLVDTGLEYSVTGNDTFLVDEAEDPGNARTTPRPVMMAQASVEEDRTSQEPTERRESEREIEREKLPIEEIVVTGTHIRGIAPESSPVRVFDREDIQISGAATAQDFIQTLTENFGGGSNSRITDGLPNDPNSGFNSGGAGSLGTGVNLRGLGSGSTLVLLNGRRLAPSSGIGDFVDISMIPATAIERVEVLTDGASSIYGSDAVAGVVNFILRDDFEGFEASIRHGIGTQSNTPKEYRAGATGGLNWDSGRVLVSYEYFRQDAISVADRPFSEGIILPNDLQPRQTRHSILSSFSQNITSNLDVSADLTFSNRDALQDFTSVATGNQFRATPSSENFNASFGGAWEPISGWFVDFSGTYSEVNVKTQQSGTTSLAERDIDSNIWTADLVASGTLFELPAGELKWAVGGQFRNEDFSVIVLSGPGSDRLGHRTVCAAFGEAYIPILTAPNAIPGVHRLEATVSGRIDDYSDFGSSANPKVGLVWSPVEPLSIRGSYSTSFNPPPLGRVNPDDLAVSAFETSFVNSLFGFRPGDPSIADVVSLTVAGTGRDLDAENSRAFTAGFDFSHEWNRHRLSVNTTWFNIKFENRIGETPVPGGGALAFFNAPNIAFNDPNAFPEGTIIFSPTLEQITELVESANTLQINNPPVTGDPFDAQIINLVRVARNLATTRVRGLDISVDYKFSSTIGDLTLGLDGSYLNDYQQQVAVVSPSVEQVSTLFNPIDLRLRGRAGFSNEGFTANLFVNYSNHYRVDNNPEAVQIDAWTTVDLSLSYDTGESTAGSVLNNTVFRLNALNLFDQNPPSTPGDPGILIFGYDPTNASPLGRFITFEISKKFEI